MNAMSKMERGFLIIMLYFFPIDCCTSADQSDDMTQRVVDAAKKYVEKYWEKEALNPAAYTVVASEGWFYSYPFPQARDMGVNIFIARHGVVYMCFGQEGGSWSHVCQGPVNTDVDARNELKHTLAILNAKRVEDLPRLDRVWRVTFIPQLADDKIRCAYEIVFLNDLTPVYRRKI